MNCGPHMCQSGLKAGRMEQNYGSIIDFLKNFDFKALSYSSNYSGLIEPKDHNIVHGYIISLIQLILMKVYDLRGPHKIASRAACSPRAAGWKALL